MQHLKICHENVKLLCKNALFIATPGAFEMPNAPINAKIGFAYKCAFAYGPTTGYTILNGFRTT